ncbi:HoxN/HupN/NixA family nickel/cobalt transporter [Phytoactinopolyspora halotolerans]|uniref:Nickel/cobalt efflux system n=1 Tax=Phytoactinopolyspora halotolerans TaxID=1981512 RepID=A0A6L9SDR6_9ACTN|nr:hypothetical protein [Phytoactinopolyspora halotolerans]NEE02682.1 hypothetical protein [Phytoactinopolyspora halotolerans]
MNGLDAAMVRAFDTVLAPVAVLIAAGVGAAHALRPGHGKTMVAAYLLGEQGRRRHAVALAGIVAGMHTASVLALGLLWWVTTGNETVSIETVTTWGQMLVAVVVLTLGVAVSRRRWRAFRRDRVPVAADVSHGSHHHGGPPHRGSSPHHVSPHHHGPPAGADPWSRAGLAGIASVGALVPSPAAFLVLISGLLTGRAELAVVMVAVFGLGLGTTVLATGLVVLAGRDWLNERAGRYRWLGRFAHYVPLAGACAVLVGGGVLVAVALADLIPMLADS